MSEESKKLLEIDELNQKLIFEERKFGHSMRQLSAFLQENVILKAQNDFLRGHLESILGKKESEEVSEQSKKVGEEALEKLNTPISELEKN